MDIKSSDISVVIQGRVDAVKTLTCINALRKLLPHAEIIISTWDNLKDIKLPVDSTIYSEDPGGFYDYNIKGYLSNLKRIVVSTQQGVKNVTRPYTLKIRGDMFFQNCNFINYFNSFPHRNEKFRCFEKRVIFSSYFTKEAIIDGKRAQPTPFHLSDWFAFGLSRDIQDLFDIPVPDEPSCSLYFKLNTSPCYKTNVMATSSQYAPEQYVGYHFFKKYYKDLEFENHLDYSVKNIQLSKQLILNNCIILDPQMIQYICTDSRYLQWTKRLNNLPKDLLKSLYTFEKFKEDYEQLQ